MNLIQLRDRVQEVIAENERRGWSDRNELPVVIRMNRHGKGQKRFRYLQDHYFPLAYVSSAMCGIGAVIRPENRAAFENVVCLETDDTSKL